MKSRVACSILRVRKASTSPRESVTDRTQLFAPVRPTTPPPQRMTAETKPETPICELHEQDALPTGFREALTTVTMLLPQHRKRPKQASQLIPLWQQADPKMHTEESLRQRRYLKEAHPSRFFGLAEALEAWWLSMTTNSGATIVTKHEYVMLCCKIYKVLNGSWDADDALRHAEEDWERDSKGEHEMNRDRFTDGIFQLADHWTFGLQPAEYTGFLRWLLGRVSTCDPFANTAIPSPRPHERAAPPPSKKPAAVKARYMQPRVQHVNDYKPNLWTGNLRGGPAPRPRLPTDRPRTPAGTSLSTSVSRPLTAISRPRPRPHSSPEPGARRSGYSLKDDTPLQGGRRFRSHSDSEASDFIAATRDVIAAVCDAIAATGEQPSLIQSPPTAASVPLATLQPFEAARKGVLPQLLPRLQPLKKANEGQLLKPSPKLRGGGGQVDTVNARLRGFVPNPIGALASRPHPPAGLFGMASRGARVHTLRH